MVPVNPRSAVLGQSHVILNGRARDYHVAAFAGPLSIKSVLCGSAIWQTDEGDFEIGPGSALIINHRQPYSITVESRTIVETLCVFFADGFVEDVYRALTASDATLLENPAAHQPVEFQQRLRSNDHLLTPLLRKLHQTCDEDDLLRLAEALAGSQRESAAQASKIGALKPSTEVELLRRVHRGRNVIEGSLSQPIALQAIAREAALSPYHFHRCFTRVFGETPNSYVTRRRMERAAALLSGGDMPVTDVALACGYQSVTSFSGLFRRHTGAAPREFRRRKLARFERF